MQKPLPQTYWYLCPNTLPPLTQDLTVDIVIVGGGMAGITAAHEAHKRGLRVALLEKAFVGAGASGRSSGFITPDAEFSFADLVRMHGEKNSKHIWGFIDRGVQIIAQTINEYALDCQYQEKDTLMLASSRHAIKRMAHEHEMRSKHGLKSTFHDAQQLKNIIDAPGYYAGLSYDGTFAMKAFDYCQGLKQVLVSQGAHIFEESPVISITSTGVKTAQAQVHAEKIIVATDYQLPDLAPAFNYDCYHVQTFLIASAPLPSGAIQKLFPFRAAMAWDTDLIYHYFRLTADNRLLLGGGDLFSTYNKQENWHNNRVFKSLKKYAQKHFPQLNLEWEYQWPGLIGITKDLFPLAGKDKNNPNLYYISGAAGLPWAASLGKYAVEVLLDKKDEFAPYFDPYRRFLISHSLQALLGQQLTFALCNFQKVSSL